MINLLRMKIVLLFLVWALSCTQLTGCENENAHVPGGIDGPKVVYGLVEDITRTGTLNIEKAVSDGYYADGEFVSGNEAYYVVIKRHVLIKAGIKFDREGRYLGRHSVVITGQDKVSLEPGHPDIYEITSIMAP